MQTNGGLSQTDERRVPRETIDGVSTNGNESPTQRELLTLPVARMKGVGAARAELMAKLGIRRAYDLLFNFPRDYLEVVLRRDATALTDDAVQSIAGEIIDFSVRYTRRGTLVTLNVDVKKDVVQALWFNMPYIANSFRQGRPLILTGKPKKKQGFWQFSHPKLTYLDSGLDIPWNMDGAEGEIEEKFVLPVYSLTEGLSQAQLQRVVRGGASRGFTAETRACADCGSDSTDSLSFVPGRSGVRASTVCVSGIARASACARALPRKAARQS